jgi:hypothetical protein
MLVFSRQGAASGIPILMSQNPGPRINVTGGNFNVGAGTVEYGTGIAYTTAALSTEFAVLFDVQNGKFYYTGGGASVSLPANNVNTGSLVNLYLGNNAGINSGVGNIYIRAYARWSAATGISAADFQSIVNNPQQLVNQAVTYDARVTWAELQYQASGAPVTPTDYSEPLSRGIFRGIERGVA